MAGFFQRHLYNMTMYCMCLSYVWAYVKGFVECGLYLFISKIMNEPRSERPKIMSQIKSQQLLQGQLTHDTQ